MDYKVIWTDGSLRDVEAIAKYIEKDSFYYACSVVTKIIDTTKNLELFPFAGRVVPEENDDSVREHFVYNYRVIYEVRGLVIYVLAVVHGKRMLSPDYGERMNSSTAG
ncbi:MAG: type II toxin-antitoxin system RelE/ParE family toxin [Pseudomonadota bacterium]|nr:type II toxin-antitoxin system RelE/ParE family toxin [Pseudomonadota bacterium]